MCIPRRPFARLIEEIVIREVSRRGAGVGPMRITVDALAALQETAEAAMVQTFEMSNHLAVHAKRVTLMPKDIDMLRTVMGMWDMSCWLAKNNEMNGIAKKKE
jgi:histone H3/H4